MADVSLEPADGDPFAGQIPAEFPNQQPQQQEALAADPQRGAAVAAANESVWEHLKRKFPETSWGHLYNTLTTAVPKLQSGEWDVSSPEAAERTGALGGALEVGGLGMGGGVARPGEAVLGAGPIYRRRPAYTPELPPLDVPPPPMGHNMPPPEARLEPQAPPIVARPSPVVTRTAPVEPQPAPPPPLPIEAPAPAIGAQQPVTPHQPVEEPPPPVEEAPPPPIEQPEAPAPRVKKPPPFIKQEDPFTAPIGEHPLEEALTVNDILHPDYPAQPSRSRGIEDIAQELHERSQQALKDMGIKAGRITDMNDPVTNELLARSLASEAKRALEAPGANAGDWYTGKVKEAMDTAALMYPEIATDPGSKAAFQAALAITSQGEAVPSNVRLATQAYDYFRENGRFPQAIQAKEGPSMGANFTKFNKLVDALGLDGTREFLDAPTTPRQLTQDGHKVGTSETLDEPVYGSHIFGAKIGNGFYQNLGGNYNPVTFDLWWMRNWNRKTGDLVGLPDIAEQRTRFEQALGNPLESQDADQQALYAGKRVPKTLPGLDKIAEDIRLKHERDFRQFRSEYNAKTRVKSELTNAAARYQAARFGINQAPKGGGQRAWMRRVTYRARDLLEQEGHKVTPADLQAILWYPEKDLYGKMGGRPSEDINIDYATALMQEARRRGHIGDQPTPLLPSSGRPGPASALTVGAGDRGGGAAVGGQVPAGEAGPGGAVDLAPHNGDPFDVPPGTY